MRFEMTVQDGRMGRSSSRPRRWSRRQDRWILICLVGALLIALGAILGTASPLHPRNLSGAPPTVPPTTSPVVALAAQVTTDPANGAVDVPPDFAVTVKTGTGKFRSVILVSEHGQAVSGTFDPAGNQWTSVGYLAMSTKYTLQSFVTSQPGVAATTTTTFTTLSPAATVTASVSPAEGTAAGIGQPLIVTLSRPVSSASARSDLLRHLDLHLSQVVPVGAYWYSPTEIHLRPQSYWPAGERIDLTYDLGGWDAGSDTWGTGSGARHIVIGTERVSTLNLAAGSLTVTVNGSVTGTYAVTRPKDAMVDGPHIVLGRQGQSDGLYWVTVLSDSGSSICALGRYAGSTQNSCASMGLGDAEKFFDLTRSGDVVVVSGGTNGATESDHGTVDWNLPWSAFTPITVTQATSA